MPEGNTGFLYSQGRLQNHPLRIVCTLHGAKAPKISKKFRYWNSYDKNIPSS